MMVGYYSTLELDSGTFYNTTAEFGGCKFLKIH